MVIDTPPQWTRKDRISQSEKSELAKGKGRERSELAKGKSLEGPNKPKENVEKDTN